MRLIAFLFLNCLPVFFCNFANGQGGSVDAIYDEMLEKSQSDFKLLQKSFDADVFNRNKKICIGNVYSDEYGKIHNISSEWPSIKGKKLQDFVRDGNLRLFYCIAVTSFFTSSIVPEVDSLPRRSIDYYRSIIELLDRSHKEFEQLPSPDKFKDSNVNLLSIYKDLLNKERVKYKEVRKSFEEELKSVNEQAASRIDQKSNGNNYSIDRISGKNTEGTCASGELITGSLGADGWFNVCGRNGCVSDKSDHQAFSKYCNNRSLEQLRRNK